MSLRSLARELSVTATAVSLALKNNPRISADLRRRVQALARERGYVPNARLVEVMTEIRKSATSTYRATLGAFSLYPDKEPWLRPHMGHLRLLLDGAIACAATHGYRLDYFWSKEPGLTASRFCKILEARGIQGLYCLGSLDPEEQLPAELARFAITTQGASIPSKLHRISSHFAADASEVFDQLRRRGYERPGLLILPSGDRRSDYEYSATYLSALERLFPQASAPVLRIESWDEAAFHRWFRTHKPDVIVAHQHAHSLTAMEDHLRALGLRIPRDLGLALLDQNPDPSRYSGVMQDFSRMGAVGVEMLIGRVQMHDFAPPKYPKREVVTGKWNEGKTLRKARR